MLNSKGCLCDRAVTQVTHTHKLICSEAYSSDTHTHAQTLQIEVLQIKVLASGPEKSAHHMNTFTEILLYLSANEWFHQLIEGINQLNVNNKTISPIAGERVWTTLSLLSPGSSFWLWWLAQLVTRSSSLRDRPWVIPWLGTWTH